MNQTSVLELSWKQIELWKAWGASPPSVAIDHYGRTNYQLNVIKLMGLTDAWLADLKAIYIGV